MYTKLISTKRATGVDTFAADSGSLFRSPFLKDYDRIVFSNPFRRLSKKTQVHPLAKNDHVHNRLTHSLEVASVGRTLGLMAGDYIAKHDASFSFSPYDVAAIIQSACLAHDIGNPPFGHAGEEIIKEWFSGHRNEPFIAHTLSQRELNDFLTFDGNAQSVRIVTRLENHRNSGGMRLTLTTIAAMIKYPWLSDDARSSGRKFNYFLNERALITCLADEFGFEGRHPFSYLMEAADDICYALLDMKDGVELGMYGVEDVHVVFELLCPEKWHETVHDASLDTYQKISRLCAFAIANLTQCAFDSFIASDVLNGGRPKDLLSVFVDERLKNGLERAKRFGHDIIFREPRKIELELGAYNVIGLLLENLMNAAYEKSIDVVSFKSARALDLMPDMPSVSTYEAYQNVLDYIVGMTDNYASSLAAKLGGQGYM